MRSSGGNAFGAVEVAQVTALIAEIERAAAGPAVRSATSAAGWYPNEQAAPGKALDQECCANCHGDNFVAGRLRDRSHGCGLRVAMEGPDRLRLLRDDPENDAAR
jgi:mono/diheme cytochrome c family protein